MRKILKVFTKKDCPKCPKAKVIGLKLGGKFAVEMIDCSSPAGLREAQKYNLLATPALIIVDKEGKELNSWRGEVPTEEEVIESLGGNLS